MRQKQIDLFFTQLDKALDQRASILLVGASAGSLMGHVRPSLDIDFEIRFPGKKKIGNLELERKIQETARRIGVAVNFSENIGHWSMVNYLDYRQTAVPYKKFGKLEVKLMAPEYWTIGKMARFYALDIQDMIKIIKVKNLRPEKLAKLWRRVLRTSDLSIELGQFQKHAVYFVKTYGRKLWGKKLNVGKVLKELS